jgi:Na+/citrate or Na+/malate symporter
LVKKHFSQPLIHLQKMTKLFSVISKISYIAVLLGLFLPFMVLKCSDQDILKATGVQLITGKYEELEKAKSMADKNVFDDSAKDKKNTDKKLFNESKNVFVIAFTALALIGLGLSFVSFPNKKTVLMILSAVIVGLMCYLPQLLEKGLASSMNKPSSEDMKFLENIRLTVKMQAGYYLSLIGAVLIFLEPLILLFKNEDSYTEVE